VLGGDNSPERFWLKKWFVERFRTGDEEQNILAPRAGRRRGKIARGPCATPPPNPTRSRRRAWF